MRFASNRGELRGVKRGREQVELDQSIVTTGYAARGRMYARRPR
jgi:hypothetical protein